MPWIQYATMAFTCMPGGDVIMAWPFKWPEPANLKGFLNGDSVPLEGLISKESLP